MGAVAERPDLLAEFGGDPAGQFQITVSHDQDLGRCIGHVSPGKPVSERNRQHPVLFFKFLHTPHQ